ncbi:MAG: T9SS type A sorting domain-containing protein [candidate division Zixibacteria bacterium]|nr:T9SS type A sorting domain-containing protein [candidate division Zixibacteria bacterium]
MGHATDADLCSAIPVRQSPMVEVARYAVNGVVAVRLAWSSRVEIDNLPLQFFERPSFSISTISPASIQHSVHGNVAAALQRSGDQPVLLNPGERIDLEYSLSAVPSGVRRVLICAIRGRYERDNAGRQAVTVPSSFSFEQNYPNPFNPSTTFRFGLPTAQLVRLELYNILGQRVGTLANSAYEAGYHQIDWDGQLGGQPVASGVYLARLVAGPFHATRKMMVVK